MSTSANLCNLSVARRKSDDYADLSQFAPLATVTTSNIATAAPTPAGGGDGRYVALASGDFEPAPHSRPVKAVTAVAAVSSSSAAVDSAKSATHYVDTAEFAAALKADAYKQTTNS